MSDSSDNRHRIMHELVPPEWDKSALGLAHEIRAFLKSIIDAGTDIDSGGGDGIADLWPIIEGREFHIQIKAKEHKT